MMPRKLVVLSLLLTSFLVSGCQTAPPPLEQSSTATTLESSYDYPAASYRDVPSEAGTVYRVDGAASQVRILVYRGGTMAAAGHNHVIVPTQMRGAVLLPPSGLGGARMDIAVPLDALEVDPPAARDAIGGSFAGTVNDKARSGTRDNMLGSAGLDTKRFETLGLRVREVYGELPRPILRLEIFLHGQSHTVAVPVVLKRNDERLRASGRFAIRQSWFNIKPFAALGGALQVQDWLTVEFEIVADAAGA